MLMNWSRNHACQLVNGKLFSSGAVVVILRVHDSLLCKHCAPNGIIFIFVHVNYCGLNIFWIRQNKL